MVYLQQLLNGLSIGGIYALFAAGLALAFGVVGLLNFAHGEFYMLGAYVAWLASSSSVLTLPYIVTIMVAVAALILFGEVIRRLTGLTDDRTFETMVLLTLALSIIMQNGATAIWGPGVRGVDGLWNGASVDLEGLRVSGQRLFVLLLSIAVAIALDLWVHRSRIGKCMNAIAQNRTVAVALGMKVATYSGVALAISAGLAGLAGAAVVPISFAFPTMGVEIIVKGFAAVIVAGLRNIRGCMAVALGIGVLEALTTQVLGLVARDLVAYVILAAALVWRPNGLFSRSKAL